jgi:hypothetical protein
VAQLQAAAAELCTGHWPSTQYSKLKGKVGKGASISRRHQAEAFGSLLVLAVAVSVQLSLTHHLQTRRGQSHLRRTQATA